MRVGVVLAQIPVAFSLPRNVETILGVLAAAEPGDIVVTPEGSLSGYLVNGRDDLERLARTDPVELANAIDSIAHEAVERRVHVWLGVCRQQDGAWSNDAVGLLGDGTRSTYRKVNLATGERGTFRPGDELPVFDVPTI